jgi:hypothetical protein
MALRAVWRITGATTAFAVLAILASAAEHGSLSDADRALFDVVRARRGPARTAVAQAVSTFGEPAVVCPILIVVAALDARRAGWRRAYLPCLAVVGGAAAASRREHGRLRPAGDRGGDRPGRRADQDRVRPGKPGAAIGLAYGGPGIPCCAVGAGAGARSSEPDLNARFVPLDLLPQLDLRPPVAGHLRALHGRSIRTAAYFGNLWRPRHHDDLPPTLLEFTDEPAGEMPL